MGESSCLNQSFKKASLSKKSTNSNFKQNVFDFTTNFEVDCRSFETSSSKKFRHILYSCTGRCTCCHRPRSRIIFRENPSICNSKKKLLVEHWLTLLLQPKLYCKLN